MRSVDGLPDLLKVEEAAALLRISRGKAYDLAREWRTSGGEAGLPVLDFGNVLRVPRHALETMVGGPLSAPTLDDEPTPVPAETTAPRITEPTTPGTRSRTRSRVVDQLALFDPPSSS